ncbi:hypothetical protein BS50DRAFT_680478 [Corynespora cassiicola Philippines]|uniref:Uncharacterized protein n=1 Tax=Corynespora cassiicola Philippines TaxID=1448308 RepID=A0A2T2N9U3_CORCC|nr:hypothetical protein BS50DRAFT_680478 [Corynespora cassiicola Philippines]
MAALTFLKTKSIYSIVCSAPAASKKKKKTPPSCSDPPSIGSCPSRFSSSGSIRSASEPEQKPKPASVSAPTLALTLAPAPALGPVPAPMQASKKANWIVTMKTGKNGENEKWLMKIEPLKRKEQKNLRSARPY